jgi:hypothetical protein
MLSVIIPESPVFHFDILSALGRWVRGLHKVFEQPLRIELKEIITDLPDGPVAIIHGIQPFDGEERETYTYWNGGALDTSGTFFFERDTNGKIARIVPPEENAVPIEWKASLSKFEDKRQQGLTPASKRFG